MVDPGREERGERGRLAAGERLAREIRRLRREAGLSQPEVAARVGYTRQYVSLAERPRRGLPSAGLVAALDAALEARGALIELRERADEERRARRARPAEHEPGEVKTTPRVQSPIAPPDSLIVPQGQDEILVANTGLDTLELLRRVRASAINSSTVDAINITVEQLCCDYAHADARELIRTGKEWLGKISELLAERVTLDQHRDMLNNAGMLALLVGCLEYDVGDARSAEATRRMAMELGKESGDPGIVGWAHEMLAWFHLTAGNYRAVIPAAQAGSLAAPSHSVAVQLYGQQAKAYARLGMVERVHEALANGRSLLDKLPYPARPEHHFVVDPDKWDFYAMDTYRIVGEDQLAKRNAEEVIRRSVNSQGALVAPMRNAEAQLTLAVIAARQGDVEEATALGIQALQNGRRSRPSLLMVASELAHELDTYGAAAGAAFRDQLDDLKRVT